MTKTTKALRSRCGLLRKKSTAPAKEDNYSSCLSDCTEDLSESLYEQARFRDELVFVQQQKKITKVTLQDFVGRYERDDILALHDIIRLDERAWKVIKFQDNVEGANYRRWQFKKENVRRFLSQADKDERIPIVFEALLEIDMDEMPLKAILDLLRLVRKDPTFGSIRFTGALNHKDMKTLVGYVLIMLQEDIRNWKGVVFRFSFDGEGSDDYEQWDQQVKESKRRLKAVGALKGIPVSVTTI